MAYDEGLAERIREAVRGDTRLDERHMFGGIAFLYDGHMVVGIVGETLMVRVGPEAYVGALARRHVRPMDFTGKPMKGYIYVDPPGIESDADLAGWIAAARDFVTGLPPKLPKAAKTPRQKSAKSVTPATSRKKAS